ncbi:DUF3742 family protein [Pseudomonas mosselii]|uniref:DUF3742 family protein n=1 Tax=Pseudomonas mosselii TaxID=78327 RepID=UPI0027DE693F|nr:DUF3742 family protein [Pseudomonas mosselii]
MKQRKRMSIPERVCRWAGRAWCAYLKHEKALTRWCVVRGVPALCVTLCIWVIKLIAMGVALYFMFWIAFFAALAIAAMRILANGATGPEEPASEWRDGLSGYGLYDSKGFRIDPHDPDEEA